jgi:hypothetical protein
MTEEPNKKRGRKKKDVIETEEDNTLKKRGRKPKGGKLIQNTEVVVDEVPTPVNVILHLKCSIKDLETPQEVVSDPLSYNPTVPPEIMSYESNKPFSYYSQEQSLNNVSVGSQVANDANLSVNDNSTQSTGAQSSSENTTSENVTNSVDTSNQSTSETSVNSTEVLASVTVEDENTNEEN